LAPLNAQIDEFKQAVVTLEGDLRGVEAELETFAAERQQVDVLQDACAALDRLQDLGAFDLFWDGLADGEVAMAHSERLRGRIADFEAQTAGLEEKRESLQTRIDQQLDELDYLYDEVQQAYAREERRLDEFVIDREVSSVPYQPMLMPWSKNVESEGRFRRVLLLFVLWSLFFGVVIPLINVPLPDRTQAVVVIPERLAMLLKQEPPVPAPALVPEKPPEEKQAGPEKKKPAEPEKVAEAKKAEPEKKKPAEPEKVAEVKKAEPEKKKPAEPEKVAEAKKAPKKPQPRAKPAEGGTKVARKKAEKTGVLAFKSSFSDLMDEVPVAKLGTEARLKKTDPRVPGQARAQRALTAIQANGGSSGGISNYDVSRDLGNGGKGGGNGYGTAGQIGEEGGGNGYGTAGQIGGVGFAKVESNLADLTAEEGRPLSDGPGAGRTDEEIQIVFDRYKATLYRIYNRELRKDPTLRGELLLRIIIEPDGAVSFCKVESTDLASPDLVAKIVARIERFNFGPKDDVPPITILYPIDFLPAS
jgi:outer membrane biosynthesis protein TonB